jgi:hypothetical protein
MDAKTLRPPKSVIHEDGSVHPSQQRKDFTCQLRWLLSANGDADDDASVRAVKESPTHKGLGQGSLAIADIPTIRISTESDGDRVREAAVIEAAKEPEQQDEKVRRRGKKRKVQVRARARAGVESRRKVNGTTPVVHAPLEKPVQAAADNSSGAEDAAPAPATTADAFSFSNKRLCERWLDNLFMVLYTKCVWCYLPSRSQGTESTPRICEFGRSSGQKLPITRLNILPTRSLGWSGRFIGDLGLRLNHKEEAKEAYQRCLDSMRFSLRNRGSSSWKCILRKVICKGRCRLPSG